MTGCVSARRDRRYKLSESCSCGPWSASRSRITRTHRCVPCLLPTENYLEPHCRPRQDVDRHRGVWAYVSRVSVPRRPLNLLLIRTVRELLSRDVQSSLTPSLFPPCSRPGRLKAGGCIKLSCQSYSGEATDCCRAESPRGRPLKVRQLAFPSTVQEDLLRHISFRFCTLARSAVPR